jgi:hypothetical protein
MHIPKDLQAVIGQREIKRSLQTASLNIAKLKSRYLAGNIQHLFRSLREAIRVGELKDIPKIVRSDIKNLLQDAELNRARGDKSAVDELYKLLSKKSFSQDLDNLKHKVGGMKGNDP